MDSIHSLAASHTLHSDAYICNATVVVVIVVVIAQYIRIRVLWKWKGECAMFCINSKLAIKQKCNKLALSQAFIFRISRVKERTRKILDFLFHCCCRCCYCCHHHYHRLRWATTSHVFFSRIKIVTHFIWVTCVICRCVDRMENMNAYVRRV